MGFFVPTDEQNAEAEDSILSSITDGTSSVNVDGMNVSEHDPLRRVQALQLMGKLATTSNPIRRLHVAKLISPGGGG